MSRFANCNYQVLQIRSSYKQRLEQWRSTSLKLGIAKIPEQSDWKALPDIADNGVFQSDMGEE